SAEQPSQVVPWGTCLIHNWQEERATNHLDHTPGWELGSEGFVYQHGHHGLLAYQLLSQPTDSTTMKDAYRSPHRVPLLRRGQREAMLEAMLFQKYRQAPVPLCHPPLQPCPPDPQSSCAPWACCPLCPWSHPFYLQPHNYCTEQPCSFWLEHAHSLPGVTSICTRASHFRRNTAFSTPITEYLELPLPCSSLSSHLQSRKQ
ncbi:SPAG8 protein, partial [Pterocles burchelli]|nr:SPAG8 protein [Pterocles burchelli]